MRIYNDEQLAIIVAKTRVLAQYWADRRHAIRLRNQTPRPPAPLQVRTVRQQTGGTFVERLAERTFRKETRQRKV